MKIKVALVIGTFLSLSSSAIDLFGKGSVSKNYLAADKSTISVSLTGGLAIAVFRSVRIEGRYSNISTIQNKLDISSVGTLSDIYTQTAIYSVGLDIDFLGEKSSFQPFIYLGVGYIETERSYYFTDAVSSSVAYYMEPKQTGLSGNVGLGIRLRIARSLALELEAFAYALDIQKPNPLPNLQATAGLRLFI